LHYKLNFVSGTCHDHLIWLCGENFQLDWRKYLTGDYSAPKEAHFSLRDPPMLCFLFHLYLNLQSHCDCFRRRLLPLYPFKLRSQLYSTTPNSDDVFWANGFVLSPLGPCLTVTVIYFANKHTILKDLQSKIKLECK